MRRTTPRQGHDPLHVRIAGTTFKLAAINAAEPANGFRAWYVAQRRWFSF